MADWVIIADDNEINIKMAGRILSKAGMRVTAMKSGESLIKYVEEKDQTEAKGLAAGAMDFIKKPFVPEILTIRVRHTRIIAVADAYDAMV